MVGGVNHCNQCGFYFVSSSPSQRQGEASDKYLLLLSTTGHSSCRRREGRGQQHEGTMRMSMKRVDKEPST